MGKKQKKSAPQQKAMEAAQAFVDSASLQMDPQGSYTGKDREPDAQPVQDADDL